MLGNKGMFLETILNKTIKLYKRNNIGLFHKKDVPIKFGSVEKNGMKLKVKDGYIAKKSTTDYYGVYKGRFVSFEAKSTQQETLPLSNIHSHQIKYLKDVEKYGGVAFFIIGFNSLNRYFILKVNDLDLLERKSIDLKFIEEYGIELDLVYPGILDFSVIVDSWI